MLLRILNDKLVDSRYNELGEISFSEIKNYQYKYNKEGFVTVMITTSEKNADTLKEIIIYDCE
jgi:hypothetical protein